MTGSSSSDALAKYREKRDFARTAEPEGRIAKAGGNRFVVQKHAASRLHYDLRLELDGVLKSWAVTRGPSINPDDKRLAVRTEDHPVEYATFEGTIPKSEYGGGTMMLWDTGTWESLAGKDPSKTLPEGHLHFFLHGHRLKGEWILFRLKPRGNEKGENWILRKVSDDQVGGSEDLVGTHLTGVVSGLTMEEIAAGERGKPGARATPAAKPARKAARSRVTSRKRAGSPPPFQPVQLATPVDHVPAGNAWLHEMKDDGYRTLVAVGGGTGRAYTRSGLDWTDKFAGIVADAVGLDASSALIDGEAVVVDAAGKIHFQALQAALKGDPDAILYYAFDLLALDGEDLTGLPLSERKAKLAPLLGGGTDRIRYSDHIAGRGEELFDTFCAEGLEGVISKRADARYVGSRSGSWLKTKCIQRQEFVIVGWLPSDKQRGFKSLLLGVNEDGHLRYLEARHADGLVGRGKSATLDAVEAFQRRNGLKPDRDLGGAHSLTRQRLAPPVAKLVRAG